MTDWFSILYLVAAGLALGSVGSLVGVTLVKRR